MRNYNYKYIFVFYIKARRELSISEYVCVVPINELATSCRECENSRQNSENQSSD